MTALARSARGLWTRFRLAVGGEEAKQRILRESGVSIGRNSRIYTHFFGSEPYLISIGDHCTVTSGVRFVTHDGSCWVLRDVHPDLQDYGPIRVENNSFIGVNAVILPNVRIGPNAIVAAGAVVTRDVAPNTVVGGVPAKFLMTVEEFGRRKIQRVGGLKVPSDSDQRRRYLLDRFHEWLHR
jgi:acetyltransferase-like isoleucine patch superfamily enzyme